MQINGREVGLTYTIGVMCEIGDYVKKHADASNVDVLVTCLIEMSKAYCAVHGGDPVTKEEIKSLPGSMYEQLQAEVLAIQEGDSATTVETKPVKGKKKELPEKQS